ncbi:hypothetical protein DL766_004975 [Monosporascus sp. MC13-8B]|uniref:Major facilitator superfamily (MFS) profile domain-containing protein n=1 Tax=Monosporascus cannonballus TaxID=155416 RepID=A0ABY0H309_9PEZI|nr:hypothetical protein DL762_006090 [Monosporascus cannonballus]RYO88000.1 hypothetical protein DL763_006152 [Monosporascus cannonballus]RYP30241.1 hypothetical protein DL766_004975 [Monosporascus sp. MC13-8B]
MEESVEKPMVEGAASSDGEISTQYVDVRSIPFILVVTALSFSLFCVGLDNIIIATAIPRITDEFNAINDIAWYGAGYLLPTCAFQLLSGKLYSQYSAKWIFLGALFIFEVGSLISAVAPTSAVFIAGRAIAGVGAAALFTGSLVIIATIVPPEKAPAFQSVNAGTFGVASAVGPLVLFVAFLVDQFFMGENATIPPRVARQRTVAAVCWYNLFSFGAFNTAYYFIPLYFQGIKATSAQDSGIRMIPLVVTQVIIILIVGIVSAKTGHYVPFFIASGVVGSIGMSLLTTWQVDSSVGSWIGYQVIIGFGLGMGMQLFATAVSATLPDEDVPTGMALTTMAQFFGASIFLGVGNNVFETKLIGYVNAMEIPELEGHTLVSAGATTLRDLVPVEYLPGVLDAYMKALGWTFRISLILEGLAIIGAVGMEWKRVRGYGP